MAYSENDSPGGSLLERLKVELARETRIARYLPRSARYENLHICDVLENQSLSLRARGLLAFALTRAEGLAIALESLGVFGPDDRVSFFAALLELEDKGFALRGKDRWDFVAVPIART